MTNKDEKNIQDDGEEETIILKSLMSRADASTRRSTAQTLANMPNHGCEGEVVDEVHIPFAFILFSSKISYLQYTIGNCIFAYLLIVNIF